MDESGSLIARSAALETMTSSAQTIIVLPTHDHPSTLGLAIRSVLAQTTPDFELVVVGDGVGEDTRDVMADMLRLDERIRFEDRPKGQRHGEVYRHEILNASDAEYVAYQGDDDLWAPDHLATMLALIEGRDFVHPLPVRIVDGAVQYVPTDLARPECIAWHLQPTRRNAVDLTGVLHTMESYRRLPHGWRAAPPDRWTDHYMWEQYFALEGFTAATGTRPTTVKFGDVGRDPARRAEVERLLREWWDAMQRPDFATRYADLVAVAAREAAIAATLERAKFADAVPPFLKSGPVGRILRRASGQAM